MDLPNEDGSERRFMERIVKHRKLGRSVIRHHFYWCLHNCLAHPLIGVCPTATFFRFHDWTARKINVML